MTYDTLEGLISQFLQFRFEESIFGWQGGEPTLAGIDFFKKVVELREWLRREHKKQYKEITKNVRRK